jgi:hypothetical protein
MSTRTSYSRSPDLNAASKQTASAANAQRRSDERLSLLPKSRILKMCRLLENKKRRALSNEEARALTDRIESILYKSSANDHDVLDRIKSILAERQQNRVQPVSTSSSPFNSAAKQTDLLEHTLGTKRMSQIEQLVSEINAIRSGTSWAGIIRASLALNASTSLARKMPREVDAIYFRTRLVSAYAHTKSQACGPSFDPEQVHAHNWSELIDEAKANITAYRNLEDTYNTIITKTPVVPSFVGNPMCGVCTRKESPTS